MPHLEPRAGVACCGSATGDSVVGNVESGTAFAFSNAGSKFATVWIDSCSAGVVGVVCGRTMP